MHGGAPAVVEVADVAAGPHAVAIGALAGLRGEILVARGVTWISSVEGDSVRTVRDGRGAHAALLVAAEVRAWRSILLDRDVPFERLDEEIATRARAQGLDLSRPFPFRIDGEVADLQWHVIDGKRLRPGSASHAAHREAALRGKLAAASPELVGFYSPAHEGVFTHHGERTHLHALLSDPPRVGHVDSVTLRRGARLYVPRVPHP
jgi:acetolactate decarboxylase